MTQPGPRFGSDNIFPLTGPQSLAPDCRHSSEEGAGRLFCPVCEKFADSFNAYGLTRRPSVHCPNCHSLERHRLAWTYFVRFTDLCRMKEGVLLHVAPERGMEARFRGLESLRYLSVDRSSARAMVKMDLTDLAFPDRTFDVIYCRHVLEHIPDERRALEELYRSLKVGGWAVIQVPVIAAVTYEDDDVIAPPDRERVFGQHDHVRSYGPDFEERLARAGFAATHILAADVVSPEEMKTMAISSHHDLFHCQRRREPAPRLP